MRDILKKNFGFDNFLPFQESIINDVLNKKDVLAILPTGGGKSLCYQLPALTMPGITIVISPLIALMKDQVGGLEDNNIPAAYLNSSVGVKEDRLIKERLKSGEVKLLYVAPERILKSGFLSFLSELPISLIAIDEAHCISEWGHDFRPSYRGLAEVREKFPEVPVLALTATATAKVIRDIEMQLGFNGHGFYRGSFDRKNLAYLVQPKVNAYSKILDYILKHPKDSGIIYCHSRAAVDQMAYKLNADGVSALPYHAGLPPKERASNQDQFMSGKANVIVATIAFGMGIDKPDIRFVIHYDLPKNIEGYYQETGRAGRDGKNSQCILFFSYSDKIKHEYFIKQKIDPDHAAIQQAQLDAMVNMCGRFNCRRKAILHYFGEKYLEANCKNCDVCL